ncbi:restriction endonuclease subunit S [Sphingobacterium sp. JUb20]|uniref:restriction endonuclease subunit S n=1 Tax=Sphingobacterium sp. JUb20 TaxID=2485110 RepID=UPI001045D434|nr:restriction endonuclease subunit S [Sphingobacterium sp. JUb20]TCQ96830.1 type I restriction enzyme S subunit [Sphingobacterium sp. JUb20]
MRFPDFHGEWETKKLGEIMDFKVTNSLSRENLNYEVGAVKNIHYGDIHTKFQTLFNITNEIVPFINDEINVERISDENYCREGDIIFADASEDLNDVGKSIEIINVNGEKLLSGLHTLLARPKSNVFHLGFNGYLFKSNSLRTQIQKESQGSKVLSINIGRISKIELSFPNVQEQGRITALLSLLDERMQTQNKIIIHYQSLIRNLRNKIFKQRLKFSDEQKNKFFNWETIELGIIAEKRIVKNREMRIKTVFSNSASFGIINQSDFFDKEIANQNNINGYYIVEKDDFIYNPRISKEAPVGPISMNKIGTGVMSPLYLVFRLKKGSPSFYEHFFNSNVWYVHMESIANYGARADRMSFSNSSFFEMPIPLPPTKEQDRIATFLSLIAHKIQIEKGILKQLEKQKKHLLQQMFI